LKIAAKAGYIKLSGERFGAGKQGHFEKISRKESIAKAKGGFSGAAVGSAPEQPGRPGAEERPTYLMFVIFIPLARLGASYVRLLRRGL